MSDEVDPSGPVLAEDGRNRNPYTSLPDWVRLSGISTEAGSLYWVLKMHVNVGRGDNLAWPGGRPLSALMGVKRADRLSRYLKELVNLGAIDIRHEGMPRHNVYVVHTDPPDDYRGPRTLKEWYALHRAPAEESAQVTPVPRKTGEQSAHRKSGQQAHRKSGAQGHRKTGDKQAEGKQPESEQPEDLFVVNASPRLKPGDF